MHLQDPCRRPTGSTCAVRRDVCRSVVRRDDDVLLTNGGATELAVLGEPAGNGSDPGTRAVPTLEGPAVAAACRVVARRSLAGTAAQGRWDDEHLDDLHRGRRVPAGHRLRTPPDPH